MQFFGFALQTFHFCFKDKIQSSFLNMNLSNSNLELIL